MQTQSTTTTETKPAKAQKAALIKSLTAALEGAYLDEPNRETLGGLSKEARLKKARADRALFGFHRAAVTQKEIPLDSMDALTLDETTGEVQFLQIPRDEIQTLSGYTLLAARISSDEEPKKLPDIVFPRKAALYLGGKSAEIPSTFLPKTEGEFRCELSKKIAVAIVNAA